MKKIPFVLLDEKDASGFLSKTSKQPLTFSRSREQSIAVPGFVTSFKIRLDSPLRSGKVYVKNHSPFFLSIKCSDSPLYLLGKSQLASQEQVRTKTFPSKVFSFKFHDGSLLDPQEGEPPK